jgi:hypothetical protein
LKYSDICEALRGPAGLAGKTLEKSTDEIRDTDVLQDHKTTFLIPIKQCDPYADPVHSVIVVHQIFTIAIEILNISGDSLENKREAPFQLRCAAVFMKTKIVPKHQSQSVFL